MIGRGDSLVGLLALGESLSEEPYAREDKRMLEAVADPKTNDGYDEPQLREPPSERRNWHLGIYESLW